MAVIVREWGLFARGAALVTCIVAASGCGAVNDVSIDVPESDAVLVIDRTTGDLGSVLAGDTSAPAAFIISNDGSSASGALTATVSGVGYSIATNSCIGNLPPSATCAVSVTVTPSAPGTATGTLTVSASPGGSARASLSAIALAAGALRLVPTSHDYGVVGAGTMSDPASFTVMNTGGSATGSVTVFLGGPHASEFEIVTNGCSGALASGGTCTVSARFRPGIGTSGSRSASITATAVPGGAAAANLLGTAQLPVMLSQNISSATFGQIEVGVLSTTSATWTITNTGGVTSSVPTLVLSTAEIDASGNTCTAVLAPGGSCSMTLRFRPGTGGARSGTAMVSVTGSSVTLTASATGAWRVTVSRAGTSGTITSAPSGIACAPPATSCTGLFAPGSVTFQARTTNGSGVYFGVWSGSSAGTCANGPYRDCVVNVGGTQALTGSFLALNSNLVFVSSATYTPNLGGTAPYDAACNQLATSAGINNAAGTDFIAWMSDANSTAAARVGANTSGWIRMDGRVFASTRTNLLTRQTQAILNPVRYTETGADAGDVFLQTGTLPDGSLFATQTCLNWTSISGADQVSWGNSMGGPNLWSSSTSSAPCSAGARNLLCVMKKFTTAPMVATFSGKRVWLSSTPFTVTAGANPDAVCNADRPAGVAAGGALIARTTSTAASLLGMTQMYVRLDGQEVGTGLELSAGQSRNGIWQQSDGTYITDNRSAWTGSTALNQLGTTVSTCGNWVESNQTAGILGTSTSARAWFWSFFDLPCNWSGVHLYCHEL